MATTLPPLTDDVRDRDLDFDDESSRPIDSHAIDDQAPRLMTASKLCGNKVVNLHNEVLGQIDEVVIDVPRGRVAYAAMASGGFLGLGERMFAVPWAALRYDAGRQCFVMDARKESFANAPGFDKDHWPTEPAQEWQGEVHRHYGVPPYWL
jgi:sporulation protein YlmC with PRC-barrel domain